MTSTFRALGPRLWNGRYARIPGDTTAFHVRMRDGVWWPYVDWVVGDELAECPMDDVSNASQLAEAVHHGKVALGGKRGGSFLINEFGHVLVPSPSGDGRIMVVGRWSGALKFHDRHRGTGLFNLADDVGLAPGTAWDRPYLGLPHHLSARGEIYFWEQDYGGAGKVTPPTQDHDLIQKLRLIRPSGPVRFVVGCGGLILTKVPVWRGGTSTWEARYVGRLNFGRWFPEEG